MMNPVWLKAEWVWSAMACAVVAGALALLLWSMFRARAGRNCPKCLYDMSGAFASTESGPRTCPECGEPISRERQFRRTRRNWKYVPVSALLLLFAYAASEVPTVRRYGWAAALPDIALAEFSPIGRNEWSALPVGGGQNFLMPTGRFVLEIQRRINGKDFSACACRIFLDRLFRQFPDQSATLVQTRPAWPAGERIYARLWIPWMLWSQRTDLVVRARLQGHADWITNARGQDSAELVELGRAPDSACELGIEAEVLRLARNPNPGADPLAGATILYRGMLPDLRILPPGHHVESAGALDTFTPEQ